MVDLVEVEPLTEAVLEDIGMSWHTDADGSAYVSHQLLRVSEQEAEAYAEAANRLYEMYVEAAQHVIDEQRYLELGIPSNLVRMIEHSWDNDDWHLYGRFDLAGGLDGLPIRLIEFNADTPTSLFETAIVQWALLKANGMDEARQFNNLHEMLQQNFRRLLIHDEPLERFDERFDGHAILFSSAPELSEDERTVRFLQEIAAAAGYFTDFSYLGDVGFIERDGVYNRDEQRADFWFKLYPWEDIASEELELTRILESIQLHGHTRFVNPPYTLLFQSKGMLKVLRELFPDSPYLLDADFAPLPNTRQVEKKLFGREGANTRILDSEGRELHRTDGPYAHHKSVYQAWAEFPRDAAGNHYQAGVFYAWEACALGFRRGGEVLDDMSKFVGHILD